MSYHMLSVILLYITLFNSPGGHREQLGFVGCLRDIRIMFAAQENDKEILCPANQAVVSNPSCFTVLEDTCNMEDRYVSPLCIIYQGE